MAADDGTLEKMAQVSERRFGTRICLDIPERGTLAVVLLDADFDQSAGVIDRLIARIEDYDFQTTLRIAVGAACYPTHAVDVDSLKREASSRPVVSWRRGARSSPHRTEAGHHEIRSDRLVSYGSCHWPSSCIRWWRSGAIARASRDRAASRQETKSRHAAGPPRRALAPGVSEYRIGNGDKLRVEVYKEEQLSQSVQVRPDGRITLPLVGDLDATDQKPIELRDDDHRRAQGVRRPTRPSRSSSSRRRRRRRT